MGPIDAIREAVKAFTKEQRDRYMMRMTGKHVSAAIRINRESKGWSQAELGKRAGFTQSYIARLETPYGATHCTTETLCRIAAAFDCALIIRFCSWGEWIEYVIAPIVPSKGFTDEFGDTGVAYGL